MQCALHPNREASGLCHVCLNPVCVLCMSPLILDVTCASCAAPLLAARKRHARLGRAAALLVAGLVVAAGVWASQNYELPPDHVVVKHYEPPSNPAELERHGPSPGLVELDEKDDAPDPVERSDAKTAPARAERKSREPAQDWGKYAGRIRALVAAQQKEPCDRTKALELSQLLLRAGDHRGVLTRADAFFTACGDMPRLRWDMYEAHRQLSEWDLAIAEATKLIESDRTDPDFWWWRGRAEALKGDFEAAARDHGQAVALCPRCIGAWDLADALEQLGRPCEGVAPLQTMLSLSKKHLDEDRVRARIEDLKTVGNCGTEEPSAPTP
jgi:aspartyl protease family protein